jgi:predicted  nucleic acid-binding Zn-ribbon protein
MKKEKEQIKLLKKLKKDISDIQAQIVQYQWEIAILGTQLSQRVKSWQQIIENNYFWNYNTWTIT